MKEVMMDSVALDALPVFTVAYGLSSSEYLILNEGCSYVKNKMGLWCRALPQADGSYSMVAKSGMMASRLFNLFSIVTVVKYDAKLNPGTPFEF